MDKLNQTSMANPFSGLDRFSLALGGPFFQMLRRAHLTDDSLGLLRRRIVFLALLSWLPLILLSTVEGQLRGESIVVSLAQDVKVHARFLLVIPLLLAAESFIHNSLRSLPIQFLERGLIREKDLPGFRAKIESTSRQCRSALAEVIMITLVYILGIMVIWPYYTAPGLSSWRTLSDEGGELSGAGWWYLLVSIPLFQFLLIRWYYRLFIWARLLYQLSRIDLVLVPSHPDRAGGLGFLFRSVYAFVPLLMAHGALLGGLIAEQVLYQDNSAFDFQLEIIALVVFLFCLICGPMFAFAPQLAKASLQAKLEFGAQAEGYLREFEKMRILDADKDSEPALSYADIRLYADIRNGYEAAARIRPWVFYAKALVAFTCAFVAPIAALVLATSCIQRLLLQLIAVIL